VAAVRGIAIVCRYLGWVLGVWKWFRERVENWVAEMG